MPPADMSSGAQPPDRSAAALLAAYDAELRAEAEVRAAPSWERVGPLVRARFHRGGFVTYADLSGHDAPALVAATVAHFRDETDLASFEWKTRGHDAAPGLLEALDDHGLVPEEQETVMAGDAGALAVDVPVPAGVVVRRVEAAESGALAAATALQREIFGGGPDLAGLLARSGDDVEVWVAEVDDEPVACGRLDLVPGTRWGGLWGGLSRPDWRGRGLYRALTAGRARSALARGYELLQSDCLPTSRPILERSGLLPITTTTPYIWTRS